MSGPLRSFQTVHWLTMTLSLLTFSAQGSSGGGCWSQRTGSRGMQRRDSLHICGREATAGKSRSPRGHVCMCEVAQFFLTLCDATDCSPPSSSVQGISQTRILERVPFPSPGHLPDPGIEPESLAMQADSLLLSHLGSLVLSLF